MTSKQLLRTTYVCLLPATTSRSALNHQFDASDLEGEYFFNRAGGTRTAALMLCIRHLKQPCCVHNPGLNFVTFSERFKK